jgi:hypothetical protein
MFAKNIVVLIGSLLVLAWLQPKSGDTPMIDVKISNFLSLGEKNQSSAGDRVSLLDESSPNYSREAFGRGWSDDDGDCQNTRHETLITQSLEQVKFKSFEQCQVAEGSWLSPYTGQLVFKSSRLDIDHVVPLKWAWQHGAASWPKAKRIKFANYPLNLLAVEMRLNRQKGAKGPDNWLPPENKCKYLKLFATIKDAYALTYSPSEAFEASQLEREHCG